MSKTPNTTSLYSYIGKLLYTIDSVVHKHDLKEVEKVTKPLTNHEIENQLDEVIKSGTKDINVGNAPKGNQSAVINILIGKINIDLKIGEIMDAEGKDSSIFLVFKLREVDAILNYLRTTAYNQSVTQLLKLGHIYILWATKASILRKLSKDRNCFKFSGAHQDSHRQSAMIYADRSSEILKHKQFLLSSDLVMLGYSILIPFYIDENKDDKVVELLQSMRIMSQKYPKVKPFQSLKHILGNNTKYPTKFLSSARSQSSIPMTTPQFAQPTQFSWPQQTPPNPNWQADLFPSTETTNSHATSLSAKPHSQHNIETKGPFDLELDDDLFGDETI